MEVDELRFPTKPYALKLARAKKHLLELQQMLADFEDSDPYRGVRDPHTKRDPLLIAIRLKLTDEPPPDIPIIIGDFVYNVRSALDHLVAALVPHGRRTKAKFLIFDKDPWRADPGTGEYVDQTQEGINRRQSWDTAVKGMDERAAAFIKGLQPYNKGERREVQLSQLAVLNSLRNADSHYALAPTVWGIENPVVTLTGNRWGMSMRGEGAEAVGGALYPVRVRRRDVEAKLPDASPERVDTILNDLRGKGGEVKVDIKGTALIALKLAGAKTHTLLPHALWEMWTFVTEKIVSPIEDFVRP